MRDGKLFPYIFVFFTGIFGVRKVQCFLSVQVTVLLEMKYLSLTVQMLKMCTSLHNKVTCSKSGNNECLLVQVMKKSSSVDKDGTILAMTDGATEKTEAVTEFKLAVVAIMVPVICTITK